MKIIINASLNYIGGGLQVALSFINECVKFSNNQYYVMMSPNVESHIEQTVYPENFKFYSIPLLNFWQYNSYLGNLEKQIHPDVVFSVFGPVFWRPKVRHIMGFAMGHYLYPDSPYWNSVSVTSKLIWYIKKKLHFYYLKRDADYFVVETKDAANRLSLLLKKPCSVVSNTYNSFFTDYLNGKNVSQRFLLPPKKDGEFRLLSVCTSYPHKNLSIIPKVLDIFYSKGINNFSFVLTISEADYKKMFESKYHKNIINVGTISPQWAPYLYSECEATFVPSLLECFTANFPESMVMGKPILTSDLSFAHSICEDAALYFDPLSPQSIADSIILLYNDQKLYKNLIKEGYGQLHKFHNSIQRTKSYLKLCINNIKL